MTTVLLSSGMFVLTMIVKKYITPKYGDTGVHVFVALLALTVYGIQAAMTYWPGFGALLYKVGEYIVGSIAIYQVLIKQLIKPTNLG